MKSSFDFPEVRVVEASAGSGKTYALAKRYVQLLLNPSLPQGLVVLRNILAITFTNKASFEMKARILEFLKKTALNQLSPGEEDNILKPLGLGRLEAQKKAFLIMEELIHHYNFFQVQTIDSFINALLSGCAFKIGLSANFKIRHNYQDYLRYSLDELIERTTREPKVLKLFETFLHQYLFLENRTGWFPKNDMLGLLQALYEQRNSYGIDFVQSKIPAQELMEQKRQIFTLLESLHAELPKGVHKGFLNSFDNFLAKNSPFFDIDTLPDYFARPELPVTKGAEVLAKAERLWDKVRGQIRDLCEKEAYALFSPYVAVFAEVLDQFQRRTVKDDVLFLGELNRKARYLFDEWAITVEELYYRLATRFHHYLLDEFQDTSRLQWRNLFLMVEEALSTGGSLFYVGDKKQAIFNFRGGEVKLFDIIQDDFQAFNVQRETLSRNYRSQKAIVDFNNQIFSTAHLKDFVRKAAMDQDGHTGFTDEDIRQIENVFASSQQDPAAGHDGGAVRIEVMEGKNKEEREALIRPKLLELIKELRQRYAYRDMALLTRSNDEIELLTSWLMAENVFVESERTLNIKENPCIAELIAFLQFLNAPGDNLAFSRFLTGDIFSRAAAITAEDLQQFLFSLRERVAQEKDFYVYKEFRERYPETWGRFIDKFFCNVGLYPLYEFVISIVDRLQVLPNFPTQQGFVMHFLELIKQQEEEHTDIVSFLESFEEMEHEELYVNVTDSDSIKIMTIHKAKGLEFPVVIIPFLEMKVRVGTGGGLGQQSYILGFQPEGLELLRIKKKYLKFSEQLAEIQRREYVKALMSELNNIYVALTRAAKELYAFIPKKPGESPLIELLIPADIRQQGVPRPAEKVPAVSQPRHRLPASHYCDWIDFLKEEFEGRDQVRCRPQLLRGEILHYLLSQIGDLKGKDLAQLTAQAVAQGRQQYPHIPDFSEYEARLEKILREPSLQKFFAITDGEDFQEKEIVDPSGQTRRLDRLIVKDKEIWVIDYKSSREAEEASRQQVRDYLKIVAGIYPDKKAKGFILYLDDLKIEEIQ